MGIWGSERISPRSARVEREDESEGNTSPSGGDRPAGSRRPPGVICQNRIPAAPRADATVSADLEGGGRFYGQLTDCDPATVGFEIPVELCFRRIHEGEGFISYFWKFRPA